MLPWKTIIQIQEDSELPLYLQIANGIIKAIKSGVVKPGARMPGTRELSRLLQIHRKTVVNVYWELDAQGWINAVSSKGTFVSDTLPEISPRKLPAKEKTAANPDLPGYLFQPDKNIRETVRPFREITGFHDGPDVRLVPVEQLARAYRSVLSRKSGLLHLSYVDHRGKQQLRKILSDHLNDSRGMHTTEENIFISRGSQMGIYMTIRILVSKGNSVIVGDTNHYYTDSTFLHAGAKLLRARVDDFGIDVDEIEKLCRRRKIRAVYVTSHHHYPTTVTLSAARRMKLLALAEKFGFIIFEDDYDYDFHYQSSPILPLASADRHGMVVYLGTLSKTLAPSIRIGYVAAPKALISELAKLRQLIDVQGDPFLEQAVAELFALGEIRRHMKKVLKEYRLRRDFMCEMLKGKLSDVIDFKIPEGGLAIWAKYDKKIPLPALSDKLKKKGVILSNGLINDVDGKKLNSTRMGFGWMNLKEAEKAVGILEETVREMLR